MSGKGESEWMIPINTMLGSINHKEVQACSICNVSRKLREVKEEAFSPSLVSLGVLRRASSRNSSRDLQLQLMEQTKWRYTLSLLRGEEPIIHDEKTRLEKCGVAMLKMVEQICASYGGHINITRYDLAKQMLLDGCFVLEFLFRLHKFIKRTEINDDDPIFGDENKVSHVLSDITLLENQIPFIVLKKIYRKVIDTPHNLTIENDHRVADLIREAFDYPPPPSPGSASGIAHLLHLTHLLIVDQHNYKHARPAFRELKRCATKLRAEGITIVATDLLNQNPNIQFLDNFDCNISFSDGVLKIPPLYIKKTTEVKWRNLIAWEHTGMGIGYKFTSYALFFTAFICCKHDIHLLEKIGVIVNKSGKSKQDLFKMFNTIAEGVEQMDHSYQHVCDDLNNYRTPNPLSKSAIIMWHQFRRILEIASFYWKNWFAILIRDQIPTIWRLIGVLAATTLLALTIMQTYYSAIVAGKS